MSLTEAQRPAVVLVVDDDPAVRLLLERELSDGGHLVHCAADARSALAVATEVVPDVAILDIRLPGGVDGVSLGGALRRTCAETEVVLLTGFATLETAIAGVRLGACEYLLKPLSDVGELRRCVARALDHRMKIRAGRESLDAAIARAEAQRAVLDQLPLAVFLVDGACRIVAQNRGANALLAEVRCLYRDDGGRLRCAHPRDDRVLARSVTQCCRVPPGPVTVAGALRDDGYAPLRIVVAPMAPDPAAVGRAAVLIGRPDQACPDGPVLAGLYGLTPAEGHLAARLVAGASVRQACAESGITLPTARTHLSRIFAKTGTSRQTELIRLVLRGPALLAAALKGKADSP